MGLLSDIFSPNTSAATSAATGQANSLINSITAGTNADLTNSATNAMNLLGQGAAGAQGAINTGYGNATGALSQYAGQAQGTLQNGVTGAMGTILGGNAALAPYQANGGAASTALGNALGLNGPAGSAAATSAFQAAPGYQFAQDQANSATQRAAAAAGMNASGNLLNAIDQNTTNFANQGYQQYLSNLSGLGSQGLQASSLVNSNNQAAGGYDYSGGALGAQLGQQAGTTLSGLFSNQGINLGNIASGLGTAQAGVQSDLGTALTNNAWTSTNASNGNLLSAARLQDSVNSQNNAILGGDLGKITGSLLSGGSGGLSSLLGTIGNGASGLLSGSGGGIYGLLSGNALGGGF